MQSVLQKSHNSEDANRFDDEAELFAEDYQAGYVKNLLRLQQEVIKIPGSDEHYDIYLARTLYPVLLPGIELLSREIDRLTNKDSVNKIDPSIRARFNPCIFLAEYLMRNNPNKGCKLEYAELFEQFARVEKIRRFFQAKRQKIFKHFTLQQFNANFRKCDVAQYITALDLLLLMDRKLIEAFDVEELWPEVDPNETIGFDSFYDTLSKWAIEQTDLSYEDFAKIDFDRHERLNEFKKKTDAAL